jgi:hypothetical protein
MQNEMAVIVIDYLLSMEPISNLDIDECSTGTHTCHANATCMDTIGSYTCACIEFFTGNRTYCEGRKKVI